MNICFDKEQVQITPFFGMIEITTRCNSRCVYCRSWQNQTNDQLLDQNLFSALFQDFRSLGIRKLIITGGEPLLRQDLESIINAAYSHQLYTSLVTNGRLLTENRLHSLLDAGLLGITLSLDSLDPETYRFLRGCDIEPSLQALNLLHKKALDLSLSLSVNCVLTDCNYKQIPDLLKYLSDQGLPLSVQPCNIDGQKDLQALLPKPDSIDDLHMVIENLLELKQQGALLLNSDSFLQHIPQFCFTPSLPESACYYGEVTVTVNNRGDVLPCWRLPAAGNIKEERLIEIWGKETYRKQRSRMMQGHCPRCWLTCSFDWQQFKKSESMVEAFWQSRNSDRGSASVDQLRCDHE